MKQETGLIDGCLPEKLWEVRSTNTTVLKTYVKARTREEAKRKVVTREWREVSSAAKLTANQAWYGASESDG
jgi:hypothetical protein